MPRLIDPFPFPRAHVQYATSPECTREDDVGSAVLHLTANSVEDASPSPHMATAPRRNQLQWKCITFKPVLGGEEVKERWDAEGRSLSWCFDLREVGEESFCQELEQHLPMIDKLCIHYGSELSQKHPVVRILTRNEAPRLEILALTCPIRSRRTTSDVGAEDLFRNRAPVLRRMIVMPGMQVVPSALSQLERYRVLYHADEWLNGFDLHAQWEDQSEIQLQGLRTLTIKDHAYNCDQLLAKIIVPAPCHMQVTLVKNDDSCKPEHRYVYEVGCIVRRWITLGRDGVTEDRRTVQNPDANGGGDELILHIIKEYSMQSGWNATWIFSGRLAMKVFDGLERSNGI